MVYKYTWLVAVFLVLPAAVCSLFSKNALISSQERQRINQSQVDYIYSLDDFWRHVNALGYGVICLRHNSKFVFVAFSEITNYFSFHCLFCQFGCKHKHHTLYILKILTSIADCAGFGAWRRTCCCVTISVFYSFRAYIL